MPTKLMMNTLGLIHELESLDFKEPSSELAPKGNEDAVGNSKAPSSGATRFERIFRARYRGNERGWQNSDEEKQVPALSLLELFRHARREAEPPRVLQSFYQAEPSVLSMRCSRLGR